MAEKSQENANSAEMPGIYAAAKAGNVAGVARLIGADRRLVRARDRWEKTALHYAANVAVARVLIEKGADVNAAGWMGATPLHEAAGEGRADVVELLIGSGA